MASRTDSVNTASPPGEEGHKSQGGDAFPHPSQLDRQSSIYSMTLDELQTSVLGKPYGSMNMDEFLTNVWNVDDAHFVRDPTSCHRLDGQGGSDDVDKLPDRKPSLPRHGSFTLPPPLSGKTVEEVWAEIQREEEHHQQHEQDEGGAANVPVIPRQVTFGEMTLEDFLIKAGVVREAAGCCGPSPSSGQQAYSGMIGTEFGHSVQLGFPTTTAGAVPNYQSFASLPLSLQLPQQQSRQQAGMLIGEGCNLVGNGSRNGGYGFGGGRAVGAAFGGLGSPVSPLSSDGLCAVTEIGEMRNGRKRIFDGPVEKVVERRQRRMIKNRESAARSRARKQLGLDVSLDLPDSEVALDDLSDGEEAYTVELEAELNQLKEENGRLKKEIEDAVEKIRKKFDEMARTRITEKEAEFRKTGNLRRVNSWHG